MTFILDNSIIIDLVPYYWDMFDIFTLRTGVIIYIFYYYSTMYYEQYLDWVDDNNRPETEKKKREERERKKELKKKSWEFKDTDIIRYKDGNFIRIKILQPK